MSDSFDKVDRALEMRVIDWLQWTEFPEDLRGVDMAQLTLTFLGERKRAYQHAINALKRLANENMNGHANVKRFCQETLKGLGEL